MAAPNPPPKAMRQQIVAALLRFERQLPQALDMMSRAMRVGHAFPTALKLVADEVAAPLGEEFKTAFDEVNFGVSVADALNNLAQRVPGMDLQYFGVAVLIQRESGANLTELLTSALKRVWRWMRHWRAWAATSA